MWLYTSAIFMGVIQVNRWLLAPNELPSIPASFGFPLLFFMKSWIRQGQWLFLQGVTGIFKLQLPPKKRKKFSSGTVWCPVSGYWSGFGSLALSGNLSWLVFARLSLPRLRLPLVFAAFASFVLHTKDLARPLLFPYFYALGICRVCQRDLSPKILSSKGSCRALKIHLRGIRYSHNPTLLIYSNFFPHFVFICKNSPLFSS